MTVAYGHGTTDPEASGLLRVLRILRERWWVVVVALVVCVAVSLALTLMATKQYTATAKLQFAQNPLLPQIGGTVTTSADPQADQATDLLLVTTNQVATAANQALGLHTPPSRLLKMVSTSLDQSSNIVDVSATDPDPVFAARVANAFANQYVASSKASNLQQILSAEQMINQRLQTLPPTAANAATRANLQAALQRLIVLASVQTGNATVVDNATIPATPSSPNKKVNLIVAAVFGLGLGVGLAFLLNLLDRRLKEPEELEEAYGTQALATIPLLPRRRSVIADPAAVEQFLILRTALATITPAQDARTVLVTSAVSGEGKTTVAIGLAMAAASSGQSVILVETDFKRPALRARLAIRDESTGLSVVLLSDVDPVTMLHAPVAGLPKLQVLTCGPQPPNSYALLRSRSMGELLETLAAEADVVVLDAPPLLPVADAQALLDHSQLDAYLVVGRLNFTKRDEARHTRQVLERGHLRGLGLVVNGIRELAGGDVYYHKARQAQLQTPVAVERAAARK
jgi:capsular exopolysaccharide synthesis family protein